MSEQPAAGLAIPGLDLHVPSEMSERVSILVYGAQGAGKTMLAGTAADDERSAPVLFVDAEGGTGTIAYRTSNIAVMDFRDFMRDAGKLQRALKQDIPFKTIVVDSLTEIGWRAMASVTGGSATTPEPGDWNKWTSLMRSFIGLFKDAPFHLIVTCLEEPGGPKGEQMIPSFPGKKIAYNLGGAFNTVARLHTVSAVGANNKAVEVRRLTMQTTRLFDAKDRMDPLGKLPVSIDNPTMTKLLDRLAEGKRLAMAATQGE